jgi:hypothetical protein
MCAGAYVSWRSGAVTAKIWVRVPAIMRAPAWGW